MRYFVTGGAGFIGSNLVHYLLEKEPDAAVAVFDKLTYAGNPDNLEPVARDGRFELIEGDICDRRAVREALDRVDPDVIFNLAAESHVDRSIDGPAVFIQTNVVGTFTLLDAALECAGARGKDGNGPRFVHISTDEVFGSLGAEGRFTERSQYQPNSPYAASKAGADHIVRAYHHTYGVDAVTTNCSNNYGPYQFPEKLIPLVTLNALEEKPLPVYGDGKNVRDWLFVRDHCEALVLAAARGRAGETYNIGGDAERTTLEVVQAICSVLDDLRPRSSGAYGELIEFVKDRPGHDRRYAIDPSKIRRELCWQARTDFAEGIRDTVKWYLDHLEWCDRIARGAYRRERLGLRAAAT